ncbi:MULTISPECIES: pirin family protein [unclassified Mycolicibacterium]|uniref:pirin family protein n=1 Tax=unclassified Mycolicibacterium TaxID=2636767 RepID=UPI0012DDE9AE|nr:MULTISPECIES: pirin family protein [unclassified Mycolicibacterium]MUL82870.1 pirin family protein [Mycolicibacterium sp. CBMA 329]MUL89205.1 pirin family protein [Mycolicibacterium sp. CBMA 331]MUL97772.1 pirin family protein [Mycolicibacterium sp. CBMA 334]MUM25115.1 pirin family protein [Mycolicibacterium sp. CBMA 295]MUM38721.1 pirin family protein [Mycolicibacterium sp. CBMA 247]
MSNTDTAPAEVTCANSEFTGVLHAREVPLGGPRAILVRRTLPQRDRSMIGAWCFADHYGPHDIRNGRGMDVPPHPHTGLQTVSWLFDGLIEHRDSAGVHAMVRPGELNLMTAGAGICHSEVSVEPTTILHGVQLWVALPDSDRDTDRDFAHYAPPPQTVDGATLRVFLGELAESRSPVQTFTPLLGAQIDLDPGAVLTLDVDPAFEHGVLLDQGAIEVCGTTLAVADLAYQAPGRTQLLLANRGERPARAILLGGPPFPEELVMWWNFVGRSHDDIATYRELWQANDARFGDVHGYEGRIARLPAPPLPNGRLKPRPRPSD